jgi:hypothetical protein
VSTKRMQAEMTASKEALFITTSSDAGFEGLRSLAVE